MSFKVKHYAAKTIKTSYAMEWEMLLTELVIGLLCSVFAYLGFKASVLLIFVANLFIAVCCFSLITFSIVMLIKEKLEQKNSEK
ncbi:hypothetical protein B0W48_06390 [Pseudoalteromonas aliena]|uniref:Uncharacterized protein n=1 Tax=Pseudoalteromonas aliena TaxID=247523 RepID=A0A1Q2GWI3_9GAMM|nr:hypothetical protein [Pseudoalteromonas aliena]AQP99463.1 hypothetical protein B0W48_06390 [Pseudoalteromonas aliena]